LPGALEATSQKTQRKIVVRACAYTVLSFVPAIGFVFGLMGMFWGFLAVSKQRVAIGASAMFLSMCVGLIGQPFVTYWAYDRAMDAKCRSDMADLAKAIDAYQCSCNDYPRDLAALCRTVAKVPQRCMAGNANYLYFHPSTATQPAQSQPAATQACACVPVATQAAASAPAGPEAHAQAQPTAGPTTLPAKSPDLQLLVIELKARHRQMRECMTADLKMKEMLPREFADMLAMPYNHQFAAALAPPPKTDALGPSEEPNRRIAGLSPKQFMIAMAGIIVAIMVVGAIFLVRAIRKGRRE
jgi:hypothetical protein